MKHLTIFSILVLLLPLIAQADSNEDEMARYQKQLNRQVFGVGEDTRNPQQILSRRRKLLQSLYHLHQNMWQPLHLVTPVYL